MAQWRLGLLAGMASYLDSSTLVALSISLLFWERRFDMTPVEVGLAPAVLTMAVAVGSMLGGRLADRLGRTAVYAVDLLAFAVGIALVLFAVDVPMLVVGLALAGFAVGVDVPTSLALIGDLASPEHRARLLVVTQILWAAGPAVITIVTTVFGETLATALPGILFGHLLVLSLLTWAFRRTLPPAGPVPRAAAVDLGAGARRVWTVAVLRALLFTGGYYMVLSVVMSFLASFGTFFMVSVGGMTISQAGLVGVIGGPLTIVALFALARLIDGPRRRVAYSIGAIATIGSWTLPVLTGGATWAFVVALMTTGTLGIWANEAHYRVWSQELFPTEIRGAAQGITFGAGRLAAAVFLVCVPSLLNGDVQVLLWMLLVLVLSYTAIGFIFQPKPAPTDVHGA